MCSTARQDAAVASRKVRMPARSLLVAVVVAALPGVASTAFGQDPGEGFASDRVAVPQAVPAALLAPEPIAASPATYSLDDLVQAALEHNPRLAQAAISVDAARGRALQAGLYPNPTVSAVFDELGDRQGRGGVNTIPLVSQEIVTGGKLTLSRAVAEREVDQATLALAARRAELLAAVRAAYFDVLTLQQRVEILGNLRTLTQKSVEQTQKLVEAKQATRLDVVQLEVEAERIRAEAEAVEQELPAAFRRLAAVVGAKDLPQKPLSNSGDRVVPDYDLDGVRRYVLSVHPEVRSAQAGVERAKLAWLRAKAESTPNVTVSGGYVRQNQNKSNDFTVGVSLPVPVWNRNEGNIAAAQAQLAEASRDVQRVENDLTERVATAYRDYAASSKRAERLAEVRKKADEALGLIAGEKNFNFTTVQRLVAQQAVTQATAEYVKARGDAWKAASALSGLTLEEQWPAGGATREVPRP
jgi:cobalt-zinc-cadmium efflux system outer membrane protein